MNKNPRRQLSAEKEELIALGMNGGRFAEHAASQLLCGVNSGPRFDVGFWMLVSAFKRKDAEAIRIYINDWSEREGPKQVTVYKWVPGDHYYVYDQRFDSFSEAMEEIQRRGDLCAGMQERFVYNRDGD